MFLLGLLLPGVSQIPVTVSGSSNADQSLSSESQTWLNTAVHTGQFVELRWPDFSDYRKHLDKFYEFNGYSLWWTKGYEPTAQARHMIAMLQQSDRKGLSPDDYDGSRWQDRLAKLKPITKRPTDSDAAKFDLTLTVCAMRYISDLHIGKINPKRLDFLVDNESKKYDLAEFLEDHVVNAAEVAGALAQVEPAYPVYHRTIEALQRYIELAKEDDGEQLPPVKKPITPSQPYSGIPRLVRLLRLVGD